MHHISFFRRISGIFVTVAFIGLSVFFSVAVPVHAFGNNGSNFDVTLRNPIAGGPSNLFEFLQTVFDKVIIPIGGIIAALAIIYSGFLFVTAQGRPEKLKTARSALLWSLIGTAVLLGSWALAQGIASTIAAIRQTTF